MGIGTVGEVVHLNCATTLPVPPERVLQGALGEGLISVIVIGTTEDGDQYVGSSLSDIAELILALERLKHDMLSGKFETG